MSADASRWERVEALFHAVVDLPPATREATLRRETAGTPELFDAVQRLLEQDARQHAFLDADVGEMAGRVLSETRTPPRPGERYGPYRVLRVVGEGGMGVVLEAVRDDVGATVALKVLRDALLSPARRDLFAREQRLLAQLRHPGIAQLFDAGTQDDGTPWFAMELVDGSAITTWCRERRSPLAERLRLLRAACAAVQFAHQRLVVHGDLKPSNVMVTQDGAVKLVDFGVAARLDDIDRPSADGSVSPLRALTPAYASPEQVQGERASVQSDLFSLGVILYELLTDQIPADLQSRSVSPMRPAPPAATRQPPSTQARAGTTTLPPGGLWWEDLDAMTARALSETPEHRYTSADALIRDIDRYLAGRTVEAHASTTTYRLRKYLRRRWREAVSAGAAIAALVGVTAAYTVNLSHARAAAVAEADKARRAEEFAFSLFDAGDDSEAPPESLRVLDLLSRGVREAELLRGEPRTQAQLLERLAGVYMRLGLTDVADTLQQRLLQLQRSLDGGRGRAVGESQIGLGQIRMEQSRFDEAERLGNEGLAMIAADPNSDAPAIAAAYTGLGTILYWRGDYRRADSALKRSVQLYESVRDSSPSYMEALSFLANTHHNLGHLDSADAINKRLVVMSRRVYGPRHPSVAIDLINLGAALSERGRYVEAEPYLREGVDITREWYGAEHVRTAMAETILGRLLFSAGKGDAGRAIFQRALAISERVRGPRHRAVANLHIDLGNVAMREHRLDDAQREYTAALGIYQEVLGPSHELAGVALNRLGGVALERKDPVKSERLLRESLRIFGLTLPAEHLRVADSRIRLGRALLRQGRLKEAEQESRGGYELVMRLATSTHAYLRMAREDLEAEYKALGDSVQSARFGRERGDSLGRSGR